MSYLSQLSLSSCAFQGNCTKLRPADHTHCYCWPHPLLLSSLNTEVVVKRGFRVFWWWC